MITCEPSNSVVLAPARSANERTTSVPAALSEVATTAHDGVRVTSAFAPVERLICPPVGFLISRSH